jgi:molybdopterin converting factor small subunit
MPITIRLTTNFLRREAGFGDFQVPAGVKTVADLLKHVGKRTDFLFTDVEETRLRPDIEVTLNDKDIAFFPEGLQTSLKEGDGLDIFLTPLGGG